MYDEKDVTPRRRRTGAMLGAAGLLAAGAITGGILASTLSASADTSTATGGSSGTAATATAPAPGSLRGGPDPVRGDEKALSTTDAATVTAAAQAEVPGGTVYRVETDAGDGTYEAHLTKADGTPVTVKLDAGFHVTAVEDGMGLGDPHPAGEPVSGAQGGMAPGGPSGSTTQSG